ncbi:hypothetical protein TCAL_02303 [Tigriopus californicus]|uniref:Uncharacterized protein n=1 Tax=Tigriopus californicus TaxID=6832 RepID=A0A553NQ41_TIGCA|nr:hypothetical protein TCAL_02303 [Tigriopus californicus]
MWSLNRPNWGWILSADSCRFWLMLISSPERISKYTADKPEKIPCRSWCLTCSRNWWAMS